MPRDGIKLRQPYKYNVGDILQVSTGSITITGRSRNYRKTDNSKRYLYKCNVCGYDCDEKHAPTEIMLNTGYGCSICGGGNAVQRGINDLSTTVPWIMKYIANPEDGYTHSKGCRKEINFKCPDCGYICSRIIANVYNQGFSCPRCDDGYSYPEKFMLSALSQIGIKFYYQASHKVLPWCLNYKYDFLIEDLKLLIETDGEQHSCNKGAFNVPVEKQKQIDKDKINLASANGYKVIHIDCRMSNQNFIKNNIINSELTKYLSFDKVDWDECNEYGLKNIVKEICNYFNKHPDKTTTMIGRKFNINGGTVRNYLLEGNKNNWCYYDPKKSKKLCQNSRKKEVEAWYQNNYIGKFECARELVEFAKDKFNIQLATNQICQCCNNKINTTKGFICKYTK